VASFPLASKSSRPVGALGSVRRCKNGLRGGKVFKNSLISVYGKDNFFFEEVIKTQF
jgi:hypothetical protein